MADQAQELVDYEDTALGAENNEDMAMQEDLLNQEENVEENTEENAEEENEENENNEEEAVAVSPGGTAAGSASKTAEAAASGPKPKDDHSIFVNNVDFSATSDEISQYFSQCGAVEKVTIGVDKFRNRKGYAYVEFVDKDSVSNALALNNTEFKGRQLQVKAKRTNVPHHILSRGGMRGGKANPNMAAIRNFSAIASGRGGFGGMMGGRGGFNNNNAAAAAMAMAMAMGLNMNMNMNPGRGGRGNFAGNRNTFQRGGRGGNKAGFSGNRGRGGRGGGSA